jgi:hypothetical protein
MFLYFLNVVPRPDLQGLWVDKMEITHIIVKPVVN